MFEDWDDWDDDPGDDPGDGEGEGEGDEPEPYDDGYEPPDEIPDGYEYFDGDDLDFDPYDEYRESSWDPWGSTP